MTIQDKLTEEMKLAMKAKDNFKLNTIRMIRAQMKDRQIEKGESLTEEDEIAVLNNAAKKRREAIEMYSKGDRQELMENEKAELDIISQYLPAQLSEAEVEQKVDAIIAEVGASSIQDLGKVMSAAMQQLKGRADGRMVQNIVRSKLS